MALDQLAFARGWFSTYSFVGVRKAPEDGVQAAPFGKAKHRNQHGEGAAGSQNPDGAYVEQTALKLPE